MKVNKGYAAAGFGLLLVFAVVWLETNKQQGGSPVSRANANPRTDAPSAREGSAERNEPPRAFNAVDFDLDAMSVSAKTDAEAARLLGAFVSICSLGLGNEYSNERAERFEDARWTPWLRKCDRRELTVLMSEMGNWAQPNGPDWDALQHVSDLGDSLDELAHRDDVASRILQESDDPELVAQAANLYFDRERLRAWASSDLPRSLAQEEVSDFSVDLALMLACRVGRDCSSSSIDVVAECAATSMCYPGMSMEQVVTLRRSPQDMVLLRRYVQRVLERRKGT